MAEVMADFACAQCGRAVSANDELRSWKHGDLLLADELDDVTATMLLCPECVAEDRAGDYETGGAE